MLHYALLSTLNVSGARVGLDTFTPPPVAVGGGPEAGVGEEEGGEVGADDVGEVVEVVGPPGAWGVG